MLRHMFHQCNNHGLVTLGICMAHKMKIMVVIKQTQRRHGLRVSKERQGFNTIKIKNATKDYEEMIFAPPSKSKSELSSLR